MQTAVDEDAANRASGAAREIEFVAAQEPSLGRLLDLHRAGDIPERITHNDTKLNNVMIDVETAEGLAFCLQQGRDFDKLTSLSSELGGMLVQTAGPIIQTAGKQGAHAAVIEAEAVAQSEEVDSR